MKEVKAIRGTRTIPTYVPKKPNELPMFFEKKPYQGASGHLYPLPYSDGITDIKKDVDYELYTLENEYVMTQVLPAMGGKILRGFDKVGKYDFIYHNEVIKPALVGIAGEWISGGIEFNWPQHHRPTTALPLEATLIENADGSKTVWTGEVDPMYRMKGMAGITIDPGRSYIRAKIKVYNRTNQMQTFMWWANLAVPVNNDYRTIFPPDVEWVNDHDRRATLSWPIAKGVYETARPFDYGEGTDISRYDTVKVPSSFLISQGQSDMDFVAGYDGGINKGIVAFANHHIAPGKKMWTWGHGEFGDMWCSNLTDENGPYIELMTGVYTDNQPDFTWLYPYETREFEQYWYPIRDLGDVKNATIDAAMNMEQRGDELFFGFNVTGCFNACTVCVRDGVEELFSEIIDLDPTRAYLKTIELKHHAFDDICVSLVSSEGKTLVSYKPYKRGAKQPIEVRKPVRRPSEYESIEELYINGYHLEQYKQHNYDPRDYYSEALRRDPNDIRCNTAMARLALRDGKFASCIEHCERAIARLTSRNQHPTDTEAFYLKGLALEYLERYDEAYDVLYRAAWNYAHRSAAEYQLATIDCRYGRYAAALEALEISLGLNAGHTRAQNLRCAILRKLGREGEAMALIEDTIKSDPLDLWARFELSAILKDTRAIQEIFAGKTESFLDVVNDYLEAGFFEDALRVLEIADKNPLALYYRAYTLSKLGRTDEVMQELQLASAADTGLCFPARLEDIAVLEYAISAHTMDANACFFLGCIYYDRFRYEDAIALWEQAIKRDDKHAKALRNLSIAYFDKRNDAATARCLMERAMRYRNDPRLLFEYQQLLKNSNVSPDERLKVYEQYPELLAQRDDCYLDRIVLLCEKRRYKEAIEAARVKHFHIYEGGEGKLTKQHAWMHVLYANALAREGKLAEAEQTYQQGVDMPKSYGEAKTWFNQEAHIFYYMGLLLEGQRRYEEAESAYKTASVYKATVSELSLFRALALRKLGEYDKAYCVLSEMVAVAENMLQNADLRSYYGVGSPSPMPFEYDIVRQNVVSGQVLRAYALLGLGRKDEARQAIAQAAKLDPYDFRIFAFGEIE